MAIHRLVSIGRMNGRMTVDKWKSSIHKQIEAVSLLEPIEFMESNDTGVKFKAVQ